MRCVPDKYIKAINTLIWDFIWDGGVNQIDRKSCCLSELQGGMGMVTFDSIIEANQIKVVYSLLHEPTSSWNAIGKYFLKKLDVKFGEPYFLCKCSSVNGLQLNSIPLTYRRFLTSWCHFLETFQTPNTKENIMNKRLFGNIEIKFQDQPLFFPSFNKSGLRTVKNIWNDIESNFKPCNEIYNILTDKRNCISELSKVKKAINSKFGTILRAPHEDNALQFPKRAYSLSHTLQISKGNKILYPKDFKLKDIKFILSENNKTKLKCIEKWDTYFGDSCNINWEKTWLALKNVKIDNKIREFQWKSIHNILYTESRLEKMKKSNGRCHFCQINNIHNTESIQHLFFHCSYADSVIKKIISFIRNSNISLDFSIKEENMILGIYDCNKNNIIFNIVIYVSKWILWKQRNSIKFGHLRANHACLLQLWQQQLKTALLLLLDNQNLKIDIKHNLQLIINKI